jgi:predicted RNA-binding Zn-ribbon protein involved in translation (DUF1610 family)
MTERYSGTLLRSLRNDLPISRVLQVLSVPLKTSEGYLRFLCPHCGDFNTATKSDTNLARCFRCEQNFNPIDLVMAVKRINFVDAVEFLLRLPARVGNQCPPRSR